jgi:REP element-mobilizing transposase RayT
MSRTALLGLPFTAADKDRLQSLIFRYSRIYFTEILGFCLMDNHFHILVRMLPHDHGDESSLRQRFRLAYGDKTRFSVEKIPDLRKKWSSLSEFVKEIKQTFSRYYNKQNNRKGYLWGDRFKSVIVQDGRTLLHCLAYIDLNPVRANMVQRPEDYKKLMGTDTLLIHISQLHIDKISSKSHKSFPPEAIMSRIPRFLKSDTSTIYHIMSRTALDGYPLSDVGKDVLLGLIKKFSSFYVVDVLGFALMGNHFHLAVRMHSTDEISDDAIRKRMETWYADGRFITPAAISRHKKMLTSLSHYMKSIKQAFTRYGYGKGTG